ncbi:MULTISPECIES: replication initiation factor domain-containing protein [Bacillaceae]|uniref:DNA polymerase n=1 Tax=Alkalicoccobacillus plakortidis TaxID=444060 RepID=A0A9D5DUH3_9BACI|nr:MULTISPECIES: replication initiation factor domain-containing protein [Bacillaceae]KQL56966.1 DNA polymerase [Alkalicoccobacillus plakortidis]
MTTTKHQPPLANRGVVIVEKEPEAVQNPLTAMVDYLRVSFKTHDVNFILEHIVHLKKAYMQEKESGFYGYIGTYQLDHIKVFYSKEGDNRGVLVEMSGQGCRQFESFLDARKKTWFDFFKDCINHGGKFSRFDLAIDDQETYFEIPMLLEKVKKGEAISRFRKSDFNGSLDIADGSNGGTTLYFGSKKSEAYLCFYEKNHEQADKYNIPLEDLGDWNRYELRLKNDRAQGAVQSLIQSQDLLDIAMQIINNYIRFVDADEDASREKWKTSGFWKVFIGDVGKLSLFMQPEDEFYEKSRRWLQNSCAPTMKMVLEADQVLGRQDLSDMVVNAELSDKQEKMLDVLLASPQDMVC